MASIDRKGFGRAVAGSVVRKDADRVGADDARIEAAVAGIRKPRDPDERRTFLDIETGSSPLP